MDIRFAIPTATFALDLEQLRQSQVALQQAPMHATIAYMRLGDLVARGKSLFFAYEGLLVMQYELPEPTVSPLASHIPDDKGGKALPKLGFEDDLYALLVRVLFPHVSPSQYMDPMTKRAVELSSPMIWANYIDLLGLCMQGVKIIVGQNETAELEYHLPGFRPIEPGSHGY